MIGVKYRKFTIFCLLLLPSIAQYSIFSGVIDFDVIIMAILMFSYLIKKQHFQIYSKTLSIYLIYTIIISVINIWFGILYTDSSLLVFLRMGRYILYWFFIAYLYKDTFCYKETMEVYRIVAYLALGYIILQAIFYYGFGILLPCKIGGSTVDLYDSIGRLSSFYSEPAELAYSLLPFIVCSLFGPRYITYGNDKRILDAVLISLVIIISTSTQGILVLLFVWLIWGVYSLKKKFSEKVFLVVLFVIIIFGVMRATGIIEFSLGRISGGVNSEVWEARSGGYDALQLLSLPQRIFGAGYGNYFSKNTFRLNTYGEYIQFSSVSESLFTNGIIGSILLFIVFIKRFIKGSVCTKVLILVLIIFSIGGSPLSGKYLGIFLPFIILDSFEERKIKNAEGSIS